MNKADSICIFGSTGDLGSQLLLDLNEQGFTTIAPVRRSPSTDSLRYPHLNKFIAFPAKQHLIKAVGELADQSSLILNCSGMNRPIKQSGRASHALFFANSVLPIILSSAAEKKRVACIHISTGDLDCFYDAAKYSTLQPIVGGLTIPHGGRLFEKKIWKTIDALSKLETEDAYFLSKLAQELFVKQTTYSKSVRLSNFYGPGYIGNRLIPRIICNRIYGGQLRLPDQIRNYVYRDELNAFMIRIVRDFYQIPGSIVWCYGRVTKSVRQISAEIHSQLPVCYGEIILEQRERKLCELSLIKKTDEYFPELRNKHRSFPEGISETIKFWRGTFQYRFRPIRPWRPSLRRRGIVQLHKGGSIAVKLIHDSRDSSKIVLQKTATQSGYEGAAAPKLRNELRYYQALQKRVRLKPLLARYARLLSFEERGNRISLFFEYQHKGQTIADHVLAGRSFPRIELQALVRDVFSAGYLSDLHKVATNKQMAQLRSLYIDRAIGRVIHFITNYDHRRAPAPIRNLFQRIMNNDVITIDSEACHSPLYWFNKISNSRSVTKWLSPQTEGFCSHGDLTILNILMNTDTHALTLIDPRGRVGAWDPVYDLSKLTFSLSGFAHVILEHFEYTSRANEYFLFPRSNSRSLQVCLSERQHFLNWLRQCRAFSSLRALEPHLIDRIEFAEATHYLADTPFRFAMGRDYYDVGAVLLLGIKCLDRAMQKLAKKCV